MIVVAPEITWLLVMTSPLESMIIPVPWSSLGPPPKRPPPAAPGPRASIDTTSGRTLFTIVGIWAPPARAGPGVSCPTRTGGGEATPFPVPTASAIPAPAAPPMRAATTATTTQPRPPAGPALEADGGAGATPGMNGPPGVPLGV